MFNLANVYASEGKYAQAEALHSQTLEIRRRVVGPEHPEYADLDGKFGRRLLVRRQAHGG
jgi:hypothetical protein